MTSNYTICILECESSLIYFFSVFFASWRWMPVVCWRREWTLPRFLSALPKPSRTHLSMPKLSCSKAQQYQPTTFWQAPASLTNIPASSFPFHLAPLTWFTGSSISPRTPWRCQGEQMAWHITAHCGGYCTKNKVRARVFCSCLTVDRKH